MADSPYNHKRIELEQIIANIPEHIFWKNLNGEFIGCNLLQARSAGFSSTSELIGKTDYDLPWKAHADELKKNDQEVITKGIPIIQEEKSKLSDGKIHTFLTNKIPLRDKKNKIIGILGIAFDITERKKIQLEIQEENFYTKVALENILNNLPGHVYWKNLEGRFLGCNLLQAQSAGFSSPKDMIGRSDYDMPWKEQADEYRRNDLQVINTGIPIISEEESTLKNKSTRTFLAHKVPLRGENNEILGVLGISLDITEQKKIQEALKRAEGQAEGMSLVSAAMAHELRTPLGSISMGAKGIEKFLPILVEAYQLAQQHKLPVKLIPKEQIEILSDVLTNIREEANQANMVINMLLTNLSVHKGKDARALNKLSMADCITKALNQYVFPPHKRKIVHEDLSRNFMFYGDEILFSHLLFNLLKNALYFIDKAGKGEIDVWLEPGEDYNELHFKDTAQGISPEDLPHIFEQFFTKSTHHGTGVGLAFCKTVMESWGGAISCRSEFGEYTEFICQFPKSPPVVNKDVL